MRFPRYLLLLLLCLLSIQVNANHPSYPNLNEVVFRFFREYQPVNDLSKGDKLKFMKSPKGWEIAVEVYNSESKKLEVKNVQIYWSSQNLNYQDLDYTKKENAEDPYIDYYKAYKYYLNRENYQSLNYAIHSFYGYENYYKDIIKIYDKADLEKNDTVLYSLGEAYLYPSFFLRDSVGEMLESVYISQGLKGLGFKKSLAERNLNFQTVVGGIHTKYGNDMLALYYNSKLFFEYNESKEILKKDAYPKWMIEFAKNYLSHCPENAILFTGGDNDTYPLIYVQEFLEFRTDVKVINRSLLMTDELLMNLRKENVLFSIDQGIYEKEENTLLVLEPSNDFLNLKSWLGKINSGDGKLLNGSSLGQRSVYLKINQDTIEWRINRARILRSELAILDIIASNAEKRPICFTANQGSSAYLGLLNYLQREGLVYVLGTKRFETTLTLNIEKMEENLLQNSIWENVENASSASYINYYYAFYQLTDTYIKSNKLEKAKALLSACLGRIPLKADRINGVLIYMVDLYAKMGEKALALSLLENISRAMMGNMSKFESLDLDRVDFKFIDHLNSFLGDVKTMIKINKKHDYLDASPSALVLLQLDSRVKDLLESAVSKQAYLKMMVGAKPLLLELIKSE